MTNQDECYYRIEQTGRTYLGQRDQFSVISSRGNKYIMVMHHYNFNSIIAELPKSWPAADITATFDNVYTYFTSRGYKIIIHKLDNEASSLLPNSIRTKDVEYQLVPPHIHRQNLAERAISAFKDHFIYTHISLYIFGVDSSHKLPSP